MARARCPRSSGEAEIVGNGKPTGSVLEETIAVSATMSISVENDTVEYVSEFFHAAE